MPPLEHPDRIQIAFDDHRLVNNAGLLLPATLAQHVGLRELVDRHLDLGYAPGRRCRTAGAGALQDAGRIPGGPGASSSRGVTPFPRYWPSSVWAPLSLMATETLAGVTES